MMAGSQNGWHGSKRGTGNRQTHNWLRVVREQRVRISPARQRPLVSAGVAPIVHIREGTGRRDTEGLASALSTFRADGQRIGRDRQAGGRHPMRPVGGTVVVSPPWRKDRCRTTRSNLERIVRPWGQPLVTTRGAAVPEDDHASPDVDSEPVAVPVPTFRALLRRWGRGWARLGHGGRGHDTPADRYTPP